MFFQNKIPWLQAKEIDTGHHKPEGNIVENKTKSWDFQGFGLKIA